MDYLQKIFLGSAVGSVFYGLFHIVDHKMHCGHNRELDDSICNIYRTFEDLRSLDQKTFKEGTLFDDLETKALQEEASNEGARFCLRFEKCKVIDENLASNLMYATVSLVGSLAAFYVFTKIKEAVQAHTSSEAASGKRSKRSRQNQTLTSSSADTPFMPFPQRTFGQQPSSVYDYQKEWDDRKAWASSGASLTGVPGCKRK